MFSEYRGWIMQQVKNRYDAGANLVKPAETTAITRRPRMEVLPPAETTHRLDVPLQSVTNIEMKTSAVDRSKGFLIANLPLFGAFAIGVWLLSGMLTNAPLFSVLGLCILWSSFVLAWLASYWYTLRVSAEGIAMFEAKNKWAVIREEQRRRWAHYERLTEEGE